MNARVLTLAAVTVTAAATSASWTIARDLTFEDRVRAQEAIERVYYAHQIGTTKPFEAAVPRAVIEGKVRKTLEQSSIVERRTRTPITPAMLRRELDRIARDTKLPDRVDELFAALGRDPMLIAECVARASLVGRLATGLYERHEDVGRLQVRGTMHADEIAYGSNLPEPAGLAN